MTGDQVVGFIALSMMLLLVMRGVVGAATPGAQKKRMALIWVVVFGAIIVAVLALERGWKP